MANSSHSIVNVLPERFGKSYLDRAEYPKNLMPRTIGMYKSALETWRAQLEAIAPNLFYEDDDEVEVCFRDLVIEGVGALEKRNIHNAGKLTAYLGVTEVEDPSDPSKILVTADKKDPKSRFIYIYAEHSRAPLRIRQSMLAQILTFHQVMPEFLDFFSSFGLQISAREVRFSGFRQQVSLKSQGSNFAINALGRSGRQYQVAYNLKGVTLKKYDPDNIQLAEWSIRTAAFYHQFDVVHGRSVWIVIKGGQDVYDRYKELTGRQARPEDKTFNTDEECFVSSLSPHVLFCRWSTEDWRGYIRWFEEAVDQEALMAVVGPREKEYHPKRYTPTDIRRLQRWEELVSEAIVVLEGNVEVLSSLRQFYLNLLQNRDFPHRKWCADEISDFAYQVEIMINDCRINIGRAKALVKTTTDRKELIIEYRGSESAERMERLNQNMKQEAVVVRIITLVTLLYLPATFVSTFFSTDIIKYDEDPNGTFSHSAMNRWLQITLPLTFITLSVAWLAKTWADRKALGTEMEFEVKSGSVMQNLRRWVQPSGLFNVAAKQSALPLLPVSNPSRSVAPLAKSTP